MQHLSRAQRWSGWRKASEGRLRLGAITNACTDHDHDDGQQAENVVRCTRGRRLLRRGRRRHIRVVAVFANIKFADAIIVGENPLTRRRHGR